MKAFTAPTFAIANMVIDSSAWKNYSKPDAELQALLPHLPPLKSFADYSSAAELRTAFNEHINQLIAAGIIKMPDWSGYIREEIGIPARDGESLRCLVHRPDSEEPGPLYIYFHGGGWSFGMPEYGEGMAEVLVKELGMTVVSVGYRLAPENEFPRAAEDAEDAVSWCAEHASKLGADPGKGFILGGTSAGGNLAAVVAHQVVQNEMSPKITGVVLLSAPLCHHEAMPEEWKKHDSSWEDHKEGLVLDRRGIEWFFRNYKPDPMSPLMSPLLSDHKEQPATYLQIMGIDPLRDEALIYEHVLREAGTPTKLQVYPGLPHGAPDFFPTHSVAKKALVDLKEGVEWILKQKVDCKFSDGPGLLGV